MLEDAMDFATEIGRDNTMLLLIVIQISILKFVFSPDIILCG